MLQTSRVFFSFVNSPVSSPYCRKELTKLWPKRFEASQLLYCSRKFVVVTAICRFSSGDARHPTSTLNVYTHDVQGSTRPSVTIPERTFRPALWNAQDHSTMTELPTSCCLLSKEQFRIARRSNGTPHSLSCLGRALVPRDPDPGSTRDPD